MRSQFRRSTLVITFGNWMKAMHTRFPRSPRRRWSPVLVVVVFGAVLASWFTEGWGDVGVLAGLALLLAVSYGGRAWARRRLLYRSSRRPVSEGRSRPGASH